MKDHEHKMARTPPLMKQPWGATYCPPAFSGGMVGPSLRTSTPFGQR